MSITRRIYVSLPADPWLPHNLNELKWGIVEEIEKLGYTPEIFTNPKGKPGLASPKAWNPRDADEIARRCVGAAVLGMPRWNFRMYRASRRYSRRSSITTRVHWPGLSACQRSYWCSEMSAGEWFST